MSFLRPADCAWLLAGKDTLRGDYPLNWEASIPMTDWRGIRIASDAGLHLVLEAVSDIRPELNGSIPVELGNLSKLESLVLSGFQLSGPIPVELANLSKLKYLRLDKNQLDGWIPVELGNLQNLHRLDLGDNLLVVAQIIPLPLSQVNLQSFS